MSSYITAYRYDSCDGYDCFDYGFCTVRSLVKHYTYYYGYVYYSYQTDDAYYSDCGAYYYDSFNGYKSRDAYGIDHQTSCPKSSWCYDSYEAPS